MDKRVLAVSGALLLLGVVGVAQTVEQGKPYYASLKLGSSMPRDMEVSGAARNYAELDTGLSVSGAVGIQLQQSMRLEVELSTRKSDIDKLRSGPMKGEVTTRALLGNLYYDFAPVGGVQPYVGAGLGFGRHDVDVSSATTAALNGNKHDNTFLYHAGLGLTYKLNQGTAADLGYRFLKSTDIEVSSANYEFSTHEFMAGLRFDF